MLLDTSLLDDLTELMELALEPTGVGPAEDTAAEVATMLVEVPIPGGEACTLEFCTADDLADGDDLVEAASSTELAATGMSQIP